MARHRKVTCVVDCKPSFIKRKHECGICHASNDLVGPFIGGPSAYYCKKCLGVIRKYTELQKEHHERFVKITEARI